MLECQAAALDDAYAMPRSFELRSRRQAGGACAHDAQIRLQERALGNAAAILDHGGMDREQTKDVTRSRSEQRNREATLNDRGAMRSGSGSLITGVPLSKPDPLGRLRTQCGEIRRHQRIVRWQTPFPAIVSRCHSNRSQVALQRFHPASVLQADDEIRGHRFADWYGGHELRFGYLRACREGLQSVAYILDQITRSEREIRFLPTKAETILTVNSR